MIATTNRGRIFVEEWGAIAMPAFYARSAFPVRGK
jgi:hypothetical protein